MYFTFCGGCKPASQDEFFFLSLIFSGIPMKSTPGKFAYILHFQQSGINATKFEKMRIYFESDVFAAVSVVDAKTLEKQC